MTPGALKRMLEVSLAGHPMLYRRALTLLRRGSLEKRVYLSVLQRGDVVFDVGANTGYFTLLFSDVVGPGGAVHAFEPVPRTFDGLARSVAGRRRYPNITLSRAACGDCVETTSIFVPAGDSGQASLRPHHDGSWTGGAAVEQFTTDVIRLDDYVAAQRIERVDFVKCDVEGGELPALRGMAETLRRDRPLLLVEAFDGWTEAFGYRSDVLRQFLRSVGYDRFDPIGDGMNVVCSAGAPHRARIARLPLTVQ